MNTHTLMHKKKILHTSDPVARFMFLLIGQEHRQQWPKVDFSPLFHSVVPTALKFWGRRECQHRNQHQQSFRTRSRHVVIDVASVQHGTSCTHSRNLEISIDPRRLKNTTFSDWESRTQNYIRFRALPQNGINYTPPTARPVGFNRRNQSCRFEASAYSHCKWPRVKCPRNTALRTIA